MVLCPTSRELSRAILSTSQQATEARTVEDAIGYHSELIDLFAAEVMRMRTSSYHEEKKAAMIREITARAEYHRDMVDLLTDIVETDQQLVWRS